MSFRRSLLLAALAALLASGCIQRLPPPETPSQELSRDLLDRAARMRPAEGRGVVVLDVTEGEASVTDLGTEADGAGGREVCTTPCVTDLSLGEHRLVFRSGSRSDEVRLMVEESPRAHRRTLSYDSGSHLEYTLLATFGIGIGVFTTPFLIDPLTRIQGDPTLAEGALIAAAAFGSAAFTAGLVGILLALIDPQMVREGASNEWRIELP